MNFFHFNKFERACFKYTIVFFKIPLKNTQIRYSWSQIQVFKFCMKLHILTILRVLISNLATVFKNCCTKHPNNTILVPDLRIFNFSRKFTFWKTWGCFKCDCNNIFFSSVSLKIPKWFAFHFTEPKWNFEESSEMESSDTSSDGKELRISTLHQNKLHS